VNFNPNKNPTWIIGAHPPSGKGEFFLEGVKQALDYKNEWYMDTANNTLFVYYEGGNPPADGTIQMSRRTETADLTDRDYIEIKNLALFGGSVLIKGAGNRLDGISSFWGAATRGIASTFRTSLSAVNIQTGSTNTIIERSEIGFGDASGVSDSGSGSIVRNNYIHDFDFLGFYDAPVIMRDGTNSKLERNRIERSGRDGIQITNKNSEVAWNDVSRSNLIADDCGLIYTLGSDINMKIHHNWLHDAYSRGSYYKAAGIYLDSSSDTNPNPEKVDVYRNVVWNVDWTAIQINWNATDINVYNNTLCKAERGTMGAWHKAGTSFTRVNVWNNLTDKPAVGANGQENVVTWEPQADKQNNLINNTTFTNINNNDFTLNSSGAAVNAGRVITGYTDNAIGLPDVGAYELGENWVAGPDWNTNNGANGTCYGLPGEACNGGGVPEPEAVAASYDFGTDTSAIFNGYTRITPSANNWTINSSLFSRDRGTTGGVNDINRDFIFSANTRTFEHTTANGLYDVLVTFGDKDYARTGVNVSAEGVSQATNITTAVGEFANRSFQTAVSDGKLSLEFSTTGDVWCVTRVVITPVSTANCNEAPTDLVVSATLMVILIYLVQDMQQAEQVAHLLQ